MVYVDANVIGDFLPKPLSYVLSVSPMFARLAPREPVVEFREFAITVFTAVDARGGQPADRTHVHQAYRAARQRFATVRTRRHLRTKAERLKKPAARHLTIKEE